MRGPSSLSPSPPPPGHKRHLPSRPRAEPPASPPLPTALVQPKEIPEQQLVPPAVSREPAMESDGTDEEPAGTEGGVPGGVIGGGEQGGGSAGDGPVYPGTGARKPAAAVRDCVQNAIRIPRDLQGFLSGPVVVEFAIRQDGAPTHFRMVTAVADGRIADAIWQAISSCQWIAGADEQGRPAWFRVRMPLRFRSG